MGGRGTSYRCPPLFFFCGGCSFVAPTHVHRTAKILHSLLFRLFSQIHEQIRFAALSLYSTQSQPRACDFRPLPFRGQRLQNVLSAWGQLVPFLGSNGSFDMDLRAMLVLSGLQQRFYAVRGRCTLLSDHETTNPWRISSSSRGLCM